MIERAIRPFDGVMALLAIRREMRAHVVHRRFGLVVIILMATDARGIGDGVVVVDVAVRTGSRRNRMRSSQGEAGLGVIKAGRRPSAGGMAHLASLREVLLRVVRIGRVVVIRQVTRDAGRVGDVVVVVLVAIGAGRKLHLIYGVLACREVALVALYLYMFALQRILRGVVAARCAGR